MAAPRVAPFRRITSYNVCYTKLLREQTEPGLRWRFPKPIQSEEIVNLSQVRTLEVGYRNNVKTKA